MFRMSQDLTAALVARVQAGPTEVVEELKARLALKEKLFQELLSDRSRQSNEHQAQVQDMLNTLSSKDQYLQVGRVTGMVNGKKKYVHTKPSTSSLVLSQDYSYRLSLVISEQTVQLQELRRQLSLREQELCELKRDKERETGGETEHLRTLLKEKEAFIKVHVCAFPSTYSCEPVLLIFTVNFIHQELMQGQEEAMQPSSTESEAETKALQEELQLVLKKEREAQVSVQTLCCIKAILVFLCFLKSHNSCVCIPQKELSALRLAHQQSMHVDVKDSSDHQVGFSFHSQP